MPIPDYESLMLPFLRLLVDGKEHAVRDIREELSIQLKLTDADRGELLPSGKQPVFNNRLGWAKTYLEKAGLVRTLRRGVYELTNDGRTLLKSAPSEISNETLARYPAFQAFRDGGSTGPEKGEPIVEATLHLKVTPQEQLENAYRELRRETEQELVRAILKASPSFFERLVVDLLVAMGYGGTVEDAGKALGRTGDGGIDGIIKEDALGLDAIYIQAKRWQSTVGRPEVQSFAGSLDGERARKGVFITTSTFSKEARDFASRIDKRIVLIDVRSSAG